MKRINVLVVNDIGVDAGGTWEILANKVITVEDMIVCIERCTIRKFVNEYSSDYLSRAFDFIVTFEESPSNTFYDKAHNLRLLMGERFISQARVSKLTQQTVISKLDIPNIGYIPTVELNEHTSGYNLDRILLNPTLNAPLTNVVIKEQFGACGVTQVMLPYSNIHTFVSDMKRLNVTGLLAKYPDMRINFNPERHSNFLFQNREECKSLETNNPENQRIPDTADYVLCYHDYNLVIQPYLENILAERRIVVSGDVVMTFHRTRSAEDNGFPHANLADGETNKKISVCSLTRAADDWSIKEFISKTGMIFGSIDIAVTNTNQLIIMEFSNEFGYRSMTTDDLDELARGFAIEIVKRHQACL